MQVEKVITIGSHEFQLEEQKIAATYSTYDIHLADDE